jgi:hypothetical protein
MGRLFASSVSVHDSTISSSFGLEGKDRFWFVLGRCSFMTGVYWVRAGSFAACVIVVVRVRNSCIAVVTACTNDQNANTTRCQRASKPVACVVGCPLTRLSTADCGDGAGVERDLCRRVEVIAFVTPSHSSHGSLALPHNPSRITISAKISVTRTSRHGLDKSPAGSSRGKMRFANKSAHAASLLC